MNARKILTVFGTGLVFATATQAETPVVAFERDLNHTAAITPAAVKAEADPIREVINAALRGGQEQVLAGFVRELNHAPVTVAVRPVADGQDPLVGAIVAALRPVDAIAVAFGRDLYREPTQVAHVNRVEFDPLVEAVRIALYGVELSPTLAAFERDLRREPTAVTAVAQDEGQDPLAEAVRIALA